MDVAASPLTLRPALRTPGRPSWDGAVWIGEVWEDAVDSADEKSHSTGLPVRCQLQGAEGYSRARLLVRTDGRPLGFVEVGVSDCDVDFGELKRRIAGLRSTAAIHRATTGPRGWARAPAVAVTVVLCTRDRPALLRTALESVLAVDYPQFETIVVDNASRTDATRKYVRGLSDPRIRVIYEPRPGASRARNAGLLAATGDVVAFADDDVVVDRYWLRALLDGFALGSSVSCVSGIVPAGELRTPAQAYFDRRVGWSQSTEPRVYDWECPPSDVPLFPFAVRCYGTGANFAVKRDEIRRLGGFDEVLGPGTSTGGGEDLDIFFRILRSGSQLVHEPAAIVWHRHRADNEALLEQTRGYGLGLGAWLAKIARDPEIARLAVKTAALRAPAFVRHIRAASRESAPSARLATLLPPGIGDETWRFILKGARAYRSALRDERRPEPLLAPFPHLPGAVLTDRVDKS
jgi:glycosyltransferase involved in cell wall biosynthesis